MTEPRRRSAAQRPHLSIYLGEEPDASRRLAAIETMSVNLGKTRSQLIRDLCDGRYVLVARPHMAYWTTPPDLPPTTAGDDSEKE